MRHLILLLCCAGGLLVLSACQQNPQPATEEADTFDPAVLQGTWKMTANLPADSTALTEPDRIQYKVFTDGHFYFVSFDEETGAPDISGGGTYSVTRDSFTENLAYTSWDSTLAGTSYTFAYTLEGDQLDQMGVMEATSEYEEFHLHERYTRVEPSIATSKEGNPLVGLWKMEAANWEGGEDPQPMQGNMTARKLFTPGHFYVATYNEKTGKMAGNVFGTYAVDGERFTETILSMTWDTTRVGAQYTYDWNVDGDQFVMSGVLPSDEDPDNKIIEEYRRVE